MKTIILTLALSLTSLNFSQARVGETKEQCLKRYGKSLFNNGNMHLHEKAGLQVIIQYTDGIADYVLYNKQEKNAIDLPLKLTDNEIKLLLESNKGKGKWVKVKAPALHNYWHNSESKLYARYSITNRTLNILSKSWMDRAKEEQEKEDAEKLKGF